MSLTKGLFHEEKLKLQQNNEKIIKENLVLSEEKKELEIIQEHLLQKIEKITKKNEALLDEIEHLKATTFRINIFFMKIIIPAISYFFALIGFIIFININSVRIQCVII
ncbi:22396_t:CDS:1 [Gigaspora margarita]|uniref:22396_t:CDS:1 n=1 Tax=Gigaspora margarita TaxID=4874 RepID=A0ABN7UMG8_GIGMA|nr:22396_t:CDS:1 [Gigaspora margarita]